MPVSFIWEKKKKKNPTPYVRPVFLPLSLPVSLCLLTSICLSVFLSLCLYPPAPHTHLFDSLSLSFCLHLPLSVFPFLPSSVFQHPSVCLPVCLFHSPCPSVRLCSPSPFCLPPSAGLSTLFFCLPPLFVRLPSCSVCLSVCLPLSLAQSVSFCSVASYEMRTDRWRVRVPVWRVTFSPSPRNFTVSGGLSIASNENGRLSVRVLHACIYVKYPTAKEKTSRKFCRNLPPILDLSAAIDTLGHQILLSRLRTIFGNRSTALLWFKSYLLDRKFVVVNTSDFSFSPLMFEVPQGSSLGPVVFALNTTSL